MGKIDRLSIARPHQSTFYNKLYDHKPLHPESAEIIPLGSQGANLCFSKQNYMRNPKLVQNNQFYHGHGLFLQFFGFFQSVEDLFTSAYYAGNQAVKLEASL